MYSGGLRSARADSEACQPPSLTISENVNVKLEELLTHIVNKTR